jgi:hypothetical protein
MCSSCSLSLIFSTKILYAFFVSSMCAACIAHPILHDFITQLKFGEEQKLWIFL